MVTATNEASYSLINMNHTVVLTSMDIESVSAQVDRLVVYWAGMMAALSDLLLVAYLVAR